MSVRLFIGNLPYTATEAELRVHLSSVGEPTSVVLPVDRETGRPRGFAFVDYADRAVAEAAIRKFDQQPFKGRGLAVSEARPREERGPGPRGPADSAALGRAASADRARWAGTRRLQRTEAWRLRRSAAGRRLSDPSRQELRPRRAAQAQAQAQQGTRQAPRSHQGTSGPGGLYDADEDWRTADASADDPEIDNVATHKDYDEAKDESKDE